MSSIVATNAHAVTGPTPCAVVRRAAIGSSFTKPTMRASATAICALSGANTAKSGADSVVNVGERSSSTIRVGTQALERVGTRSPSRHTSAFASAMYRVRVRTSASRTANSARTHVVARHPLALGARLEKDPGWRPLTEHGGEPLPTGRDATVRYRAVVGFDRQLTLALVQIQADDLPGDWPPVVRPVRQTVSAWIVVGRYKSSRYRGGPATAS
jgi:hypothetical protein